MIGGVCLPVMEGIWADTPWADTPWADTPLYTTPPLYITHLPLYHPLYTTPGPPSPRGQNE